MNKTVKKYLKIILPILLGVFLIGYSLSKVPLAELLDYFKNANYFYVILGTFFGFLSHVSRAYRWLFQLEPMGYKVRLGNSLMAVFSAYLINYTIPRAGEVARASILTTYEGVPFEKGFGSIVAERFADFIMLMSIIAITLVLQFDFISSFFLERFNPINLLIYLGIALSLLAVIIFYIRKSTNGFALKIKNFLRGLAEGAFSIFKMKKKWAFLFHTVFIWAMYVLMFYTTTFAVDALNGIPFGAVLIGFISATFSIAATNGGIGSYPVAIYAAFSIFAIAEAPSIGFGWIIWTSQTLLVIVVGGLSLVYLPIFNRNKQSSQIISK
ncbi:flippase-like domain-containing protein [Bizionia argentinensis JUB59]|uniref:Flippase-like domain-containing protein n=1 Tax=Bizionia argentinensis JUB59 TaxID=1046627 RepID=G2EH45_9FLAO|nr:lysylphosphatidylglycerol synthase transmembrane domain-containing protein [Bizionia argentinensis]EGV42091.1 flippase-like domain-containing protein [Bizionia argentinensis JUB59]